VVWNALKKAASAAFGAGIEEVTKNATKETMEAAMAVAAIVVYADGEAEKEELDKLRKTIQIHPALKAHSQVALAFFENLQQQFEVDYDLGLDLAVKELKEVSTPEEKNAVMRIGVVIAKADGEVEDSERVALTKVARILGLDIKEYLPS
jgi:tellurite resistance protein TerB